MQDKLAFLIPKLDKRNMATLTPALRRSLPKLLSPNAQLPLLRPGFITQWRGYKARPPQPARDLMTGEIIQLPDIDVRALPSPPFLPLTSWN